MDIWKILIKFERTRSSVCVYVFEFDRPWNLHVSIYICQSTYVNVDSPNQGFPHFHTTEKLILYDLVEMVLIHYFSLFNRGGLETLHKNLCFLLVFPTVHHFCVLCFCVCFWFSQMYITHFLCLLSARWWITDDLVCRVMFNWVIISITFQHKH